MDFFESTKVVFQRIQKLDPDNVSKIIGYLLLEDHAEHEMIRLSYGPDNMIQSLIDKAKRELGLSPKPAQVSAANGKQPVVSNLPTNFTPFTPSSSRSPLPSAAFQADSSQWDPLNHQLMHHLEYFPAAYLDPATGEYVLQNQPHFLPFEGQWQHSYFLANHHCPELARNPRTSPKFPVSPDCSPSLPEPTPNICEYFSKGFCKYGADCRSLHVLQLANGHVMVLNPPNATFEMPSSDHVSPRGSLMELEMELTELLKIRRGFAVPLSSIPMLYYEKYGRVLQTENYLTENRRQGNVGYGLIQLLSRMTKSIRLIDRPHGQHSVILTDDIARYMRSSEERNEQEDIVAVSCQVYLTFPPQSVFSEQDVRCYFTNFGPVKEVKIPLQDKRMFGFVTFVHPETVKFVLSKGNPHFIRGAQVLVKPYRPKTMHVDRKLEEKVDRNTSCFSDAESKPIPIGGANSGAGASSSGGAGRCDNNGKLMNNEASKDERTVEAEKNGMEQSGHHSFFSYTIDEYCFAKGFLSNGCTSDGEQQLIISGTDAVGCRVTSFEEVNLPDSPFAM